MSWSDTWSPLSPSFTASRPRCSFNQMRTKIIFALYPELHCYCRLPYTRDALRFLLSSRLPFIPAYSMAFYPSFMLLLIARSTICSSFVYSCVCTALSSLLTVVSFLRMFDSCSVAHRRYWWTWVSLTYLCHRNEADLEVNH